MLSVSVNHPGIPQGGNNIAIVVCKIKSFKVVLCISVYAKTLVC